MGARKCFREHQLDIKKTKEKHLREDISSNGELYKQYCDSFPNQGLKLEFTPESTFSPTAVGDP